MKHATAATLDLLDPLLAELRLLPGLREKKRGIFYCRSASFLHFHEDPSGIFADVRRSNGEFDRLRVDTECGHEALLAHVAAHPMIAMFTTWAKSGPIVEIRTDTPGG